MSGAGGSAVVGGNSRSPRRSGYRGTWAQPEHPEQVVQTSSPARVANRGRAEQAGPVTSVARAGDGAGGSTAMTGSPCANLPASGHVAEHSCPTRPAVPLSAKVRSEAISVDPFDTAIVWLTDWLQRDLQVDRLRRNVHPHEHRAQRGDLRTRQPHQHARRSGRSRRHLRGQYPRRDQPWKSTNGGVDWDPTLPVGSDVVQSHPGLCRRRSRWTRTTTSI